MKNLKNFIHNNKYLLRLCGVLLLCALLLPAVISYFETPEKVLAKSGQGSCNMQSTYGTQNTSSTQNTGYIQSPAGGQNILPIQNSYTMNKSASTTTSAAVTSPSAVTTPGTIGSTDTDTKDLYYQITFDSNGGSSVSSITDIIPNSKRTVPTPERKGYWFRGWFQEKTFKTPFVSGDYVSKSMTLYAKWEAKENYNKDTISSVGVTDGTYTTSISVDLTDQSYDHTVTFEAVSVDPVLIKKAANSLATPTEKYLGVNLALPGLFRDSQKPVPVTVILPKEYTPSETAIYLTTNRTTIMAQMPHTIVSGTGIFPDATISGNAITFNSYQDGTYIFIDQETNIEIEEAKEPHLNINCKKYQFAVGRETKLTVHLVDFPEEELEDYTVTWKSKNPKRASVDQKGWVTGLKKGKAKIQCKVETKSGTYYKITKLEILP